MVHPKGNLQRKERRRDRQEKKGKGGGETLPAGTTNVEKRSGKKGGENWPIADIGKKGRKRNRSDFRNLDRKEKKNLRRKKEVRQRGFRSRTKRGGGACRLREKRQKGEQSTDLGTFQKVGAKVSKEHGGVRGSCP